jgi:multisubunit Na+/H+ antiporter MnhC subunit
MTFNYLLVASIILVGAGWYLLIEKHMHWIFIVNLVMCGGVSIYLLFTGMFIEWLWIPAVWLLGDIVPIVILFFFLWRFSEEGG